MTELRRLHGQVAWIGGGASGMGEATARRFAAEGAAVVVVDVQAERGKAVVDEIRYRGGRAIFIACDVSQSAAVEAAFAAVIREFGGLHILVNCAGVAQFKSLHEF